MNDLWESINLKRIGHYSTTMGVGFGYVLLNIIGYWTPTQYEQYLQLAIITATVYGTIGLRWTMWKTSRQVNQAEYVFDVKNGVAAVEPEPEEPPQVEMKFKLMVKDGNNTKLTQRNYTLTEAECIHDCYIKHGKLIRDGIPAGIKSLSRNYPAIVNDLLGTGIIDGENLFTEKGIEALERQMEI